MTKFHVPIPEVVNLATIGEGAAVTAFEAELTAVLENILDLRTDAKAKRTITLKFEFKPEADRCSTFVTIASSSSLARTSGGAAFVHIGRTADGTISALADDPKQPALALEVEYPSPSDGAGGESAGR